MLPPAALTVVWKGNLLPSWQEKRGWECWGAVPTRVVLNAHSRQTNLVARTYLWCNMLFSLTACPLFFRYDLFLLMKKTTLQGLYSTTACVPVFSLQKHQLSRTSRSTLKRFASPPKVCVMMICPWTIYVCIICIYIYKNIFNIYSITYNHQSIHPSFTTSSCIFPQNTKGPIFINCPAAALPFVSLQRPPQDSCATIAPCIGARLRFPPLHLYQAETLQPIDHGTLKRDTIPAVSVEKGSRTM